MNDLVSVIIPVYNVEKYLCRCLDSVIKQTYKNLEIVLIDDGSTDNSGKICDQYKEKDNRIKVFHTENKGVSAARNLGIKNTYGKYIIFIDSDDFLDLNTFEEVLEENCNYDLIAFSYYKLSNNDKICYDNRKEKETLTKNETLIKIMDDRYFQGFTWNKIFKRNIIIENNLFFDENIRINEDLLFCIQFIENVNTIMYYSTPYYYYVQLNSSALHSKDINKFKTALKAYEEIEKIYIKNNVDMELFYINFFCLNLILKELLIYKKDRNFLNEIRENLKKNIKIVIFSKKIELKKKLKLIIKYLFTKQFCFIKKVVYKVKYKKTL